MHAVKVTSVTAHRCDFEQLLVRQGGEVQPICALLFLLWKIKTGSVARQLLVTRLKEIEEDWDFLRNVHLFSFAQFPHIFKPPGNVAGVG